MYLANDLFDNEAPFPLQANRGKPYFELADNGLALKNTPVPLSVKSGERSRGDLRTVVFGTDLPGENILTRTLSRFELYNLLNRRFSTSHDLSEGFEKRFDHAIRLFVAIIHHMRAACAEKGVPLTLILMSGKSFVQRPESPSARFQNYLREKILEKRGDMNVDVIDLAARLRELHETKPGDWFFPNEGHLTPAGHRVVADILEPSVEWW